ncbi:MAG: hypothetical protein KGI60_03990 [Patescibacteria group bacterium]|nr:hypothetical protein [Patescibacteria group bacterium]
MKKLIVKDPLELSEKELLQNRRQIINSAMACGKSPQEARKSADRWEAARLSALGFCRID